MGGGLSKKQTPASASVAPTQRKFLKEWENWSSVPEAWKFKDKKEENTEFDPISWNFNTWNLSYDDFITLTMILLLRFDLPARFGIDIRQWCLFMSEIERLMTVYMNPYHNYTHVIDVLQTVCVVLSDFEGAKWLTDIDVFALILSAIIHDLEHPGTNNPYQVNSSSPLAIRYNDIAVLESYHCAKAFEVLQKLNMGIFSGLNADQRKYMRKVMISAVLSTDMTTHFALKDDLDNLTTRINSEPAKFPFNEATGKYDLGEKERLTLIKSILHVSDISNPAKPWAISKKWSDLVTEEFFAQGDIEKRQNLPVSMNCDRLTTNQDELSINFTDFIVAPFFFSVTKLLPKTLVACKHLETNRHTWNTMLTQRLSATSALGEASKVEDIIGKWELRAAAFTEKIRGLETAGKANEDSKSA